VIDNRAMPHRARALPAPDPIAAIATAPGRGAVGIVRVSGTGVMPLARAITGRDLTPRVAVYGPFRDADGQPIDHGLALYFPAPHSYTGEDVLELQAHGGPVVLQLMLARCLQAAAEIDPATAAPRLPRLRLALPGEFTERAFLNDKLDLAQAEAVMDLIDASTEAAARSASRSLAGTFSSAVGALVDGLIRLRLLIEATLDFPEEEIDLPHTHDVRGQLAGLQQKLRDVQARARQGALLREGIKVVIAGQPNAGKSSLLNALAGAELAIVTPIAGTTRDAVQQTIQIQGVPLHVLDTAGLREGGDEVERIGIERAWQHIESADAVLLLHDLTRQSDPAHAAEDARIAATLAQRLPRGAPVLHVWNKRDATSSPLPIGEGIALSAKTGDGLGTLRRRLLDLAGWQAEAGEGQFIARQRHLQALTRAAAHLDAATSHLDGPAPMPELLAEELRLAQNYLNEITGAFNADDLLGAIFSRFCIGK
jgi:tRNA modification GTPase